MVRESLPHCGSSVAVPAPEVSAAEPLAEEPEEPPADEPAAEDPVADPPVSLDELPAEPLEPAAAVELPAPAACEVAGVVWELLGDEPQAASTAVSDATAPTAMRRRNTELVMTPLSLH